MRNASGLLLSSSSFSGPPPLMCSQPVVTPFATGWPFHPLQAFGQLVSCVAECLGSARLRIGRQAMIARYVSVRCTRLIALPPKSSSPEPGHTVAFGGFHEDEPFCFEQHQTTAGARRSARSVPQVCGNSSARFQPSGMIEWLRRRHPQSTCHHIEAATGIPAATVENWLIRRSQPSVEHFSTLIAAFGPAFLEACIHRPPAWIGEAVDGERTRQIDDEIRRLHTERLRLDRRRS